MRTYKRKTTRGLTSLAVYESAASEIMEKKRNYREVATEFKICHVTLYKFVKKKKAGVPVEVGYKKTRLVFTSEREKKIADYLLKCANIYFGLLPTEVKKLAYQCAVFYKIQNFPESWKVKEMAGDDWFTNFMKRNIMLSIRRPEATSLSRATSFNRTNVHAFFEKYRSVLERYKLSPSRIWNMDETGITTVQKPKKVVAGKGMKQVGAVTSAERGVLVTLAVSINAIGNAIPCMFVFPRVRYNDLFVRNGPPECKGVGNQSGWMTQKEFLKFLDHFIHHVKPSDKDPVLLLLDNHNSHVNVEVVDKAKRNHVVLLSPHCSHNLQPLDVGVYGPLKNYISRNQTNWMTNNPGKTMTIYDLPEVVRDSLPLALNPMNVTNAFRKAGIWPCNENVFQESDYAPSFVTDRPDPTKSGPTRVDYTVSTITSVDGDNLMLDDVSLNLENPEILNDMPSLDINVSDVIAQMSNEPVVGPSGIQKDNYCTPILGINVSEVREQIPIELVAIPSDFQKENDLNSSNKNVNLSEVQSQISIITMDAVAGPSRTQTDNCFVIESVRPLPKAQPRVQLNRRRTRKSAILTDTPEKQALEEEENYRNLKRKKPHNKDDRKKQQGKEKVKDKGKGKITEKGKLKGTSKVEKAKKRILEESSDSSEDECFCIICGVSFNEDISGADWVQCILCKQWAQSGCIKGNTISYICQNCDSDDEYE